MSAGVMAESAGCIRESLNESRAGATESGWDAVLGGGPKQYVDIARADDDEMRPCRLRPVGLRPQRASAASPRLPISTYWLRSAPSIHRVVAVTRSTWGSFRGSSSR